MCLLPNRLLIRYAIILCLAYGIIFYAFQRSLNKLDLKSHHDDVTVNNYYGRLFDSFESANTLNTERKLVQLRDCENHSRYTRRIVFAIGGEEGKPDGQEMEYDKLSDDVENNLPLQLQITQTDKATELKTGKLPLELQDEVANEEVADEEVVELVNERKSRQQRQCYGASVPYLEEFIPLTSDVYFFTAYWDTRTNDIDNEQGRGVIRLLVLVKHNKQPEINCLIPDIDKVYLEVLADYHELKEAGQTDYSSYMLSCAVPEWYKFEQPLCSVTVADKSTNQQVDIAVRVFSGSSQPPAGFTVCVPPLFGLFPVISLIEFIEVTRLLGASHHVFYDYKAYKVLATTLLLYAPNVTLVPWHIPVQLQTYKHARVLALQDCLYRTMSYSEYLLYSELDEVLVPRLQSRWQDMLTGLSEEKFAYQFSRAEFLIKPVNEKDMTREQKFLHFLRSELREEIIDDQSTRTIVRPWRTVDLGVDDVGRARTKDATTDKVKSDVATVHHYKQCDVCEYKATVFDDRLSKLITFLAPKVEKVLQILSSE